MSVEERIAEALEKMAQSVPGFPVYDARESRGTEAAWPETTEDAIKILRDMPPVEGLTPIPFGERFEATDLDIGFTLPGEQAFVEVIRLIRDLFEGASPEQKEKLIALHLENVRAWNKFWKVGPDD